MQTQRCDIGLIGLGTMGRSLVLNLTDHNYSVAGFDRDAAQGILLRKEATDRNVMVSASLGEFVNSLKPPRVIILLVPAGKTVDEVINELIPVLTENDLLMDWGNSHFTDTNIRTNQLAKSAIHFMGVGISGGEYGARYGPSIMPGGPKIVYERVASVLEAISAKVKGEPCVKWLGSGSAGHYVKMVHNGIEYGLMQLISESYHLLKVIAGFSNEELQRVFSKWNTGLLESFLIKITADLFSQKDELTDRSLIDLILDRAQQKGTGGWTSEDAINLQVPIPVVDAAVSMRNLSVLKEERELAQMKLKGPAVKIRPEDKELLIILEQGLYFSMICTYAQGFALLRSASKKYKYDLNLSSIASIWRGGCIIRSSLLEEVRSAFSLQRDLPNLLMDQVVSERIMRSQKGVRSVIGLAVENGIPVPALMSSLAYYDSYRSGWLPANLIQAQRDNFGAHTYERTDRKGVFHTQWNQS